MVWFPTTLFLRPWMKMGVENGWRKPRPTNSLKKGQEGDSGEGKTIGVLAPSNEPRTKEDLAKEERLGWLAPAT